MLIDPFRRTIEDVPPRHNERGAETRNEIMAVVKQRDLAGLPPATARGISRELGMSHSNILRHLDTLSELGALERVEVAEGVSVFRLPTPPSE